MTGVKYDGDITPNRSTALTDVEHEGDGDNLSRELPSQRRIIQIQGDG